MFFYKSKKTIKIQNLIQENEQQKLHISNLVKEKNQLKEDCLILNTKLLAKEKEIEQYRHENQQLKSELDKYNNKENVSRLANEYSEYKKGEMCTPRDYYDSKWESILEEYLITIHKKYELGKLYIRLLTHQPISNYIEEVKGKKGVNIKNKGRHFDFLFELRKNFNSLCTTCEGKYVKEQEKAGHFPLLAIELDGPPHRENPEQIKRDQYKNGLCNKLDISIIRIPLTLPKKEKDFLEEIKVYEKEIVQGIFDAIFQQIYDDDRKECSNELIKKYPQFTSFIEEAIAKDIKFPIRKPKKRY
ncbi:MAG: hypothetical protein HFI34_11705 [Lachnospiraceae bacterium]|nr:hypothetical protein [Lachnospiraceae bacterium]